MSTFRCPTHVTIAAGCAALSAPEAATLGARRALIATDRGVRGTGVPQRMRDGLVGAGVTVELFDEIESNPRTTTAETIGAALRDGAFDVVFGVGGGSVIDAAKAAAMLATNPGRAADFIGKNRYATRPLPFVAVPTTCGTGSEVTWVAVLTDAAAQTKISVKGDSMFPVRALVDADLLAGLPSAAVAATGMDALTHAIEAITVNCANPVSDAMAEAAIALTFRFLRRAHADIAGDAQAREAVMRASTLAGLAFGNADVAAVHCLSETLGGIYDVPHGLANAQLLAPVLRAHGRCVESRLAALDALLPEPHGDGDVSARAAHFLTAVEELTRQVEIPPFASLNIASNQFDTIAKGAVANGSNDSNPRTMDVAAYRAILDAL